MAQNTLHKIPTHIAIVMDGNRRWAEKKKLPIIAGHKEGSQRVREITQACSELGIRHLTLFAFSRENWKRPKKWVDDLMGLMTYYLQTEMDDLHKQGVCLRILGDVTRFTPDIQKLLDQAVNKTKNNAVIYLSLALNYGGRDDILQMTQSLAAMVLRGDISVHDIDHHAISRSLMTYGIPDPDLFIRTSGEMRISNFLLWQMAYTELVFTDTLWPDFTPQDLHAALLEYQNRERRFGTLNAHAQ